MFTKQTSKKSQSGVTMIEYALIAALIAIAAIAALKLIGGDVSTMFTNVENAIK